MPGLELLEILPLTLVVLGTCGNLVGNGIQYLYDDDGLQHGSGRRAGGRLWGVCVIFGAHRALLPIGLNDVAVNGRQNLLAFAGAANFAQGRGCPGGVPENRKPELRQIAASRRPLTASVVAA